MKLKQKGMIKTKSIYKPKEYGDGARILVTRFYPRGVKKTHFDRWARELAPSAELLGKYKNQNISWEEFVASFKLELKGNDDSLQVIAALNSRSGRSHVTLLCYEPEGTPCHRHLLKEIVRDPSLLSANFMPEYTDDHKGRSVEKHVTHKEACIIP